MNTVINSTTTSLEQTLNYAKTLIGTLKRVVPEASPSQTSKASTVKIDEESPSADWKNHLDINAILKMNQLSMKRVKHLKEKVTRIAVWFTLPETIAYAVAEIEQDFSCINDNKSTIASHLSVIPTIQSIPEAEEEPTLSSGIPACIGGEARGGGGDGGSDPSNAAVKDLPSVSGNTN